MIFCDKADDYNLSISNTPWHHEVLSLTAKLWYYLNDSSKEAIMMVENNGEHYDDIPPDYRLAW